MRLARSFGCAFRGVWLARTGANMRIHVVAAGVVLALLCGYGVTGAHLAVVITSVALVLSAETMNTAVERLCDLVVETHSLGHDARVRDIKDLAAGAVLISAAGAAATGAVVFVPLLLP